MATAQKELIKEFNKLKNDKARWEWVKNHQPHGVKVMCDNDDTFITIEGDEDSYASFDGYIGWSDGVFSLLEAMGIDAESV